MKLGSFFCLLTLMWGYAAQPLLATEATNTLASAPLRATTYFEVHAYTMAGHDPLPDDLLAKLLARYTGPRVSTEDLVRAAAEAQAEYRRQGYPARSISIVKPQITNGLVTLHVFPAVLPQIYISGERYLITSNEVSLAMSSLAIEPGATNKTLAATTNAVATGTTTTNAGPRFTVKSYLISGNSLLSPEVIKSAVIKQTGTNISVADITAAGLNLQKEYRNRGYPTVNVTVPRQRIDTNGEVKIRVFEGRLVEVIVSGNHHFSSNNILRWLPSLHTNEILNGPILQGELDRANANQDRQIYPRIEPGPDENTTSLHLDIKDRLPVHAKVVFNNESSPGTPDLRLNTSGVYNNLWQQEHSLGLQYSLSPEAFKAGPQWDFYDQPLVANYSAFYRIPLGNPEAFEDLITANPGEFGYSEATRQFRVPPASGQPEVTLFASRSTVDTGVSILSDKIIANKPGVLTVAQTVTHEDLTENDDLGARLTIPVKTSLVFHSGFSSGLDYKTYDLTSYQTNINSFTLINRTSTGARVSQTTVDNVGLPVTEKILNYLPAALSYDATWHTPRVTTTLSLGGSVNLWYSGSESNLQSITSSSKSRGNWVTLTPGFSADIVDFTNGLLSLRANGQLASEPLISNEQFGAGGVNSVRGYHEGEVFGDAGWRVSAEQQTPPHVVGFVAGSVPLTIRGSLYMDYATVYFLDPKGRNDTRLWGTGIGTIASLGPHWDARFLFSVPLLHSPSTSAYQPFFNFALTGQF